MKNLICLALIYTISSFAPHCARSDEAARPTLNGHFQYVRIQSVALTGNLIGDSSSREFLVLIPPSYNRLKKARYPVLYYLHGLGKRKDGHLGSVGTFTQMFEMMKEKKLPEIILVAVDGTTVFGGSYYTDSPTIGNFELYVAREIVGRVDTLFRTRREREYRAVAGFSMGGHGAIKLGMKFPEVFGQVGSLSGSPLSMRYRKSIYKNSLNGHKKPVSIKDLVERITFEENWSLAAAYAKAAAFSPSTSRKPLYLDLPFQNSSSEERDPIWQKWMDDDPLSLVSRYKENLSRLDQIYLDHGEDETTLGTEDFIRELLRYGIGINYYIFRGDHVDELFIRHVRMVRVIATRWTYVQ